MQAVILAAGRGQRIREHHTMPKGFIKINDTPLIIYSLEILRSYGIDDITLITGYQNECYDQLAQKTGWFKTLYNPEFATYGNLYSFYVAKQIINQDILLVESDIIYEPKAIKILLEASEQDVILVSTPSGSNDEVYVETQENILTTMSKQRHALNLTNILGEFVGLTRLSLAASTALLDLCEADTQLCQQGHYDEDGLVRLSTRIPLSCHLAKDLKWSEIDNLTQLKRAQLLFPHSPLSIGAST